MTSKKKLYLIGIDSAPLWLIEKLRKKYKMSGFERVMREGMLQELESTLPPVTAAAWPSIYTGLGPQGHGVMDFLCIDKNYSKQLIYYDSSKHPPFWDKLAKKNLRCLVMTPAMGLTKSSSENVDMITGWPLEPRFSSSEMERAAKKFSFKGEPDIGLELEKGLSVIEASKKYLKSINSRSELSKYLIKKNDYDMAFVCFTETDRIQHYALSLKVWEQAVAPLYKSISDFVEWVIEYSEKKGEDSVIMIVSDHGAQPIKNKFLVNSWLLDEGYAALKAKKDEKAQESGIGLSVRKEIRERVMKLKIRRVVYNALPSQIRKIAEKMVEEIPDEGYSSEKYRKIHETDFDMPNTKAFAAISFGTIGMIWLNDQRFSSPGIKNSEKLGVKREIIKGLLGLKSAEGDKLILNTYDGHNYYENSKKFIVPDIMFEMKENYINDFTYKSKGIFMEPEINRQGDHSRFGIIGILSGENMLEGPKKKIGVADVYSIITDYFL